MPKDNAPKSAHPPTDLVALADVPEICARTHLPGAKCPDAVEGIFDYVRYEAALAEHRKEIERRIQEGRLQQRNFAGIPMASTFVAWNGGYLLRSDVTAYLASAGHIAIDPLGEEDPDELRKRQGHDHYTIEQAAEALARVTDVDASRWRKTIRKAVQSNDLPLKNPRNITDNLPYPVPEPLNDFYDCVSARDINAWLVRHVEWNVTGRLGTASTPEISASSSTGSFESQDRRVDILDAALEKAISRANTLKAATVFTHLRSLARERTLPFTGDVSEDGGLLYIDSNNTPSKFTRRALDARLRRRRAAPKG